jgi:PhzF family phenazine biosynthesis protein
MSPLTYSVVDAFTAIPFKGNGAAVVVLDPKSSLSDATLQRIAAEFNLPITAFMTLIDSDEGRFGLRWFTQTVEVPLCGHATLALAVRPILCACPPPRGHEPD